MVRRALGVLLIWIIVGQGPIALAVGGGGGCLDIFSFVCFFFFFFLSSSLLIVILIKNCVADSFKTF